MQFSGMKPNTRHIYQCVGIGPGGWLCNCCAPPPSRRKAWMRRIRIRLKRELRKEVRDGV